MTTGQGKVNPGEPTDDAMRDAFDLGRIPDLSHIQAGPVTVLIAFNERRRLPDFLRHHRSIGSRHFIVVDNGSTDGTADYLDGQPDVTRLPTTKPYSQYVRAWRALVGDRWLVGRWVLFPDADEQLVYPGWPGRALPDLLAHWQDAGVDAVHGVMLDMYSDAPMETVSYGPDDRMTELCPYFDATGYWLTPAKRRVRRHYPLPAHSVSGGARRRLLNPRGRYYPKAVERSLMANALPLDGSRIPAPLQRLLHRIIAANEVVGSGAKSKIPIVRWQKGLRFARGPHRLNRNLKLAEDWCTLLHYKLLDDFKGRAEVNVARGQHSAGARGYAETLAHLDRFVNVSPIYPGSRRLETWKDLHEAGLMRVGLATRAYLGA